MSSAITDTVDFADSKTKTTTGHKIRIDFANEEVSVNSLPQASTVSFTPLYQGYALIRLTVLLVFYGVLSLAALVVVVLSAELRAFLFTAYGVLSVILLMLLLTFIAWFLYVATKAIHYSIRQHDIILKSGVFWKKEVIQPLKRVQHVELTRGPIDERYGLANVRLFSAGTAMSTFRIHGVEHAIAIRIKQFVLDYQEKAGQEFSEVENRVELAAESRTGAEVVHHRHTS